MSALMGAVKSIRLKSQTWGLGTPDRAPPPVELLTEEGKASLERINAKHKQEHIWNMIVLAAESSRYNP
jgi:hypothetical protein